MITKKLDKFDDIHSLEIQFANQKSERNQQKRSEKTNKISHPDKKTQTWITGRYWTQRKCWAQQQSAEKTVSEKQKWWVKKSLLKIKKLILENLTKSARKNDQFPSKNERKISNKNQRRTQSNAKMKKIFSSSVRIKIKLPIKCFHFFFCWEWSSERKS